MGPFRVYSCFIVYPDDCLANSFGNLQNPLELVNPKACAERVPQILIF